MQKQDAKVNFENYSSNQTKKKIEKDQEMLIYGGYGNYVNQISPG